MNLPRHAWHEACAECRKLAPAHAVYTVLGRRICINCMAALASHAMMARERARAAAVKPEPKEIEA